MQVFATIVTGLVFVVALVLVLVLVLVLEFPCGSRLPRTKDEHDYETTSLDL